MTQTELNNLFNKSNHIYKITRDIDLEGNTLNLPANCTLDFQGGTFSNGTIKLNNTSLSHITELSDIGTATITGTFRKGQVILSTNEMKWYDGTKWVNFVDGAFDSSYEEILAYGVEWEEGVLDPHLTRIGNMSLHKTLPIQSKMKGCIALCDNIIYWLDENDWRFREDPEIVDVIDLTEDTITLNSVENLGVNQYIRNGEYIAKILEIDSENSTIKVEWNSIPDIITSIEIGSRLDGYDGTVQAYIPEFYIKSKKVGKKRQVWISTVQFDETWTYLCPMLIDAFRCTALNAVPLDMGYLSTLKVNSAVSIVNTNTYCRGGNNSSSLDKYLEDDPIRTNLGKPRTALVRSTMRTYARNAGREMLSYEVYKNVFYWLYVIEYANFNSLEAYNDELTVEGYHQGGMGAGVTNENGTYWSFYNAYGPLVPCGYLNEFGNKTAIKEMIRPAFDVTINGSTNISIYTPANSVQSVSSDNKIRTITLITSNTSYFLNSPFNYSPSGVTYKITGLTEEQSLKFRLNGEILATLDGNNEEQIITIDWVTSNLSNREILSNFIGECNITIEIVSAESAIVTIPQMKFLVQKWRNIEVNFGDIWTNLDGVLIDTPKEGMTDNTVIPICYVINDPENYTDSLTDIEEKATRAVKMCYSLGYIKEFNLGDSADIVPESIGGGSTTGKCDYYWVNYDDTPETLLVGGDAHDGATAGLGAFYASDAVGYSSSSIGFRSASSLSSAFSSCLVS